MSHLQVPPEYLEDTPVLLLAAVPFLVHGGGRVLHVVAVVGLAEEVRHGPRRVAAVVPDVPPEEDGVVGVAGGQGGAVVAPPDGVDRALVAGEVGQRAQPGTTLAVGADVPDLMTLK